MLGTLTPQQFLTEHWQKKPLLVRNALPGFVSPVLLPDMLIRECDAFGGEEHQLPVERDRVVLVPVREQQ